MCGRFVRARPNRRMMAEHFGLDDAPELAPQYNIAPTEEIAIVRAGEVATREVALVRWGLIPFWAKDPKIGSKLINARAESLATAPAFRKALERRCLVPADGFFEWAKIGKKKQPYFVHGDGILAFAGLWAKWKAPDGSTVQSCTIITVPASPSVSKLHDRMPLLVHPRNYEPWLDRGADTISALEILTHERALDASLAMYPVTPQVNRVDFDDPLAIVPDPGETRPSSS